MTTAKKGIASIFISKVLVGFLGLAMVVIVSQYYGAEGRGQISLFLSSVAFLQVFMDFGNNTSLINFSYHYSNRNLWKTAFIWVFAIGILAQVSILFFPHIVWIYWVPIAAFLFSVINLNNLLFMGNRLVHSRNFFNVLFPTLLLFFFLIINSNSVDIRNYLFALFTSLFIVVLASVLYLYLKVLKNESTPFQFQSIVLKQGFWVQLGQGVQFLNYRVVFFIIAYYLGQSELGVFNNALVLGESIWILGHSLGQILHIKILNSSNELENRKTTQKWLFINLGGTLIMCFVLNIIPNSFWIMLFSKDFSSMKVLFPYLSLGIVFFSVSNILNHFFHAKNQFKLILSINFVGLVCGLIMMFLLMPEFKLIGAALSWSFGLFIPMLIYIYWFIKKRV